MGLFGGGNSSSSNYQETSNIVNDSRIGVADNGTYVGTGATLNNTTNQSQSTTTTTTTINQTVDPKGLQDLINQTGKIISGGYETATDLVNAGYENSHDLMNIAAKLSGDAVLSNQKVSQDAIDAANRSAQAIVNATRDNLNSSLDAVRKNASDAYYFAQSVNDGFLSATKDLNHLVGQEGDDNRSFATGLVDQVLARSQSADQQNYEKTLSLLKWIAAAVALAIVVPSVFRGARA